MSVHVEIEFKKMPLNCKLRFSDFSEEVAKYLSSSNERTFKAYMYTTFSNMTVMIMQIYLLLSAKIFVWHIWSHQIFVE